MLASQFTLESELQQRHSRLTQRDAQFKDKMKEHAKAAQATPADKTSRRRLPPIELLLDKLNQYQDELEVQQEKQVTEGQLRNLFWLKDKDLPRCSTAKGSGKRHGGRLGRQKSVGVFGTILKNEGD